MEHDEVPVFPRITVTTRSDGTGDVSISGRSQTVSAETASEVRTRVTEIITGVAGKLGRPVKVATAGVDGEWPLIVHPDGTVEEDASAPAPKKARKAKGRKPKAVPAGDGPVQVASSAQEQAAEQHVEHLARAPEPEQVPDPEPESRPRPEPVPAVSEEPSAAPTDPRIRHHASAPSEPVPPRPHPPAPGPGDQTRHQPGDTTGQVPTAIGSPDESRARAAQWWSEAIAEHNSSVGAQGVATAIPEHRNGSGLSGRGRRFFSRRGPEN
ncbi:hypothetical protein [Nocardiopsis xinjiangensis]|uniref:hypothetical protein n=1 Tax=Nocardiopsis xinjiangensis TaxID=124285 RepID=UPI0003483271|nr:hypothetical protein [Nocardiopsis xinjiangensis]